MAHSFAEWLQRIEHGQAIGLDGGIENGKTLDGKGQLHSWYLSNRCYFLFNFMGSLKPRPVRQLRKHDQIALVHVRNETDRHFLEENTSQYEESCEDN